MLEAQGHGEQIEGELFEAQVRDGVKAIVQQQAACGLDIVNDGEMSKVSYNLYVKDRLTGFEGQSKREALPLADMVDFPEYAEHYMSQNGWGMYARPSCNGPVSYKGMAALERDCANLKAAVQEAHASEAFMTAASPGLIARGMENHYYPTHEAYLFALADAMKVEYDTIYRAGFILQLDCPDLSRCHLIKGEQENMDYLALHIEALNYGVRDIPSERMRLHVCWGNYEGPHHKDRPLRDMIETLLRARPAGLSFEAANPRHEHEWNVFEDLKLPEGKVLFPGVLDTTTNFIEHPELVAQRIVRFASLVGRENVIASSDCGFSTFVGALTVEPHIAWAKLGAMVEGAQIASRQLW